MKRYSVIVAESAVSDLESIEQYIEDCDSSVAARRVLAGLLSCLDRLDRYPSRGSLVSEFAVFGMGQYRQVIYAEYRVIYRVDGSSVVVVAVVHQRRDLQHTVRLRLLRRKPR
jgi:plasmid stabilization system protein ParE